MALGLLPLLGLAASAPSYADSQPPSPSGTAGPYNAAPVQVLVSTLEPRAPTSRTGFLQIAGSLVNRGSQPLTHLTVMLRRGEDITSRLQLQLSDTEPPSTPFRIGTPISPRSHDLAPGARTTFDLRIRLGRLALGPIGIYPLQVQVTGQVGSDGVYGPVGSVQTLLPWFPDGPPRGHLRIAWLWPLVDTPSLGPRGDVLDSNLATSMSRNGRLYRLLQAAADGQKGACDPAPQPPPTLAAPPATQPCRGESIPVTYAVDPDLLYTADAMTAPYQQVNGDRTVRVSDTAPARSWLAALRAAVAGADVLALPYGDPDVVALTDPGSGLADDVAQLKSLGARESERITGRAPLASVVWPPAGRVTRRALDALTSNGVTAAVLDPVALPQPVVPPNQTPDTQAGLLGTTTGLPLRALVIEPELSRLLAPQLTDYPGDRLVEQRWLAETAMISAEAPSLSRTLLVAPPRRADAPLAVLSAALADTGRVPWMCPVSLASVAAGTEACVGETTPTASEAAAAPVELQPTQPDDPRLPPGFLRQVRALRTASSQFTDEVLESTTPAAVKVAAELLRARARTESSVWREHPTGGQQMLRLAQGDIGDLRSKVHLQVGAGTVTLTSSTGVISVNVVNELDQSVRVGVKLDPSAQARLSTAETPIATVPGRHASQINLKVTSQTSGKFAVIAQLVDADKNPFGPPVELVVRSTEYGRVALAVTGVAAGVLLTAAGIRITRRALRRGTG